jgi:crossover junction endodeoxyribonuclease RuvC
MAKLYVGIDPGLSGAIAWFWSDTGKLEALPTPTCLLGIGARRTYLVAEMAEIVKSLISKWGGPSYVKVAIEKVHSMPREGVTSAFTFGRGFGLWEGIFAMSGCEVDMVIPQRWQKAMLADMTDRSKDAARVRAGQLFPRSSHFFVTKGKGSGMADAALLAKYRERTDGAQPC